ncbi:hypothetical protein TNCV_2785831 [Trichonephila clavipes]|nr:hypothetical protein TNCV_2785831 [Trichonephila clavipes]
MYTSISSNCLKIPGSMVEGGKRGKHKHYYHNTFTQRMNNSFHHQLPPFVLPGYVKSLVYADKTETRDHLEDNIRRVIADIRQQMLEKVIENWTCRLDYIRASCGSPMPEIIFKM